MAANKMLMCPSGADKYKLFQSRCLNTDLPLLLRIQNQHAMNLGTFNKKVDATSQNRLRNRQQVILVPSEHKKQEFTNISMTYM